MSTIVVCKSIFKIQPSNKKSIVIAFLIDRNISIIIQLDSKLSKQIVNLDLEIWCALLNENNFNV